MKHSTISLNDLRNVRNEHEKALEDVFRHVLKYRLSNDRTDIPEALKESWKILTSLERVSLGDEKRISYLEDAIVTVEDFLARSPYSFGPAAHTLLVKLSAKPVIDLADGYQLLTQIKEIEKRNDPTEVLKFIRSTQREDIKNFIVYVSTHESQKIEDMFKQRKMGAHPIVETSGVYLKGRLDSRAGREGRMRMIRTFGEGLQPRLRLLDTKEETIQIIRRNIERLPTIKEGIKQKLVKAIRKTTPEDLFSGHPLNFQLFSTEFTTIEEIQTPYWRAHGRHKSCDPHIEWNGVYTSIFHPKSVGFGTYYKVSSINAKMDFVNAQLVPLHEELGTGFLGHATSFGKYVGPHTRTLARYAGFPEKTRNIAQQILNEFGESNPPITLLTMMTGGETQAVALRENLKEHFKDVRIARVDVYSQKVEGKTVKRLDEEYLLANIPTVFQGRVVVFVDDAIHTASAYKAAMNFYNRYQERLNTKGRFRYAVTDDYKGIADYAGNRPTRIRPESLD